MAQRRDQDNRIGIALAAMAFLLFAIGDATSKVMTEELHPVQIGAARYAGLGLGGLTLLLIRGPALLRTRHPFLQIGRGLLAALSTVAFVLAVTKIQLSDGAAIAFIAPFMVTLLAAALLGEKVEPFRWAAVAICFLATLIIIRPGMGALDPAAGWVVVSAVAFALRQIISRRLSGVEPLATTGSYTALAASGALLLLLPFVWETPRDLTSWLLLGLIAVASGCAELLIIKALEIGSAVAVAPVQYSHILWMTLLGWIVFDQLPDLWTALGAAVIIATGLWVLHRETRSLRDDEDRKR